MIDTTRTDSHELHGVITVGYSVWWFARSLIKVKQTAMHTNTELDYVGIPL
jgi:hypothetical protein